MEYNILFWISLGLFILSVFACLYLLEVWAKLKIRIEELDKEIEALKDFFGVPKGFKIGHDEEL